MIAEIEIVLERLEEQEAFDNWLRTNNLILC